MTHVVEHKSFRYSWELVRHTYILDLESDIEIQQVVLSPREQDHLQSPPYPFTRFFEVEIDQIQKNGKTVSSFRNICPVEIRKKPDWNFLKPFLNSGSTRVTRRFQSQDGDTETRWLYTDDFFLIALSSGDRHDLEMLLSLIIQKLNMIALSVQSGRRIRSEFENQQTYRAAMSTMFSEGVDGAFRDVPVYQQHGDMTESDIDVTAAVMSAELQDLTEECAYEKPPGKGNMPVEAVIPRGVSKEAVFAEKIPAEAIVSAGAPDEIIAADVSHPEKTITQSTPAAPTAEVRDPFANIVLKSTFAEAVFGERAEAAEGTETEPATPKEPGAECVQAEGIMEESAPLQGITAILSCSSCGAGISGTTKFCGRCGAATGTTPPAAHAPATRSCSRCGAGISGTTKFCGRCGAPTATTPPAESTPESSGSTSDAGDDTSPNGSRSTAGAVVNLKSIEELDDLSWLTD